MMHMLSKIILFLSKCNAALSQNDPLPHTQTCQYHGHKACKSVVYPFLCQKPSFYKYIFLLHTILSLTVLDNILGRPACIKTLTSLTYRAAPINYLLKSPQRWLDPPKRHPASLPFMQLILHNELGGRRKVLLLASEQFVQTCL